LKPSVCGVFEGVSFDFKLYYDYEALELAIERLNIIGSENSVNPQIPTIATPESA